MIVILVIIAAAGWGVVKYSTHTGVDTYQPTAQTPAEGNNPNSMNTNGGSSAAGMISARGSSDAELTQDLNDADMQVQAASQSSAAADASMNDKPGDVTY